MEQVAVELRTQGGFRASEIVADLQNAAVALYFPMRQVAYWDGSNQTHICPQERQGAGCPHVLPVSDPGYVDYKETAERMLRAKLEVSFPHAQIRIYLT